MNEKSMTSAELTEFDLRQVCWHEAGHVIVARHFQLFSWADLNFHGTPTGENRAFTGQARYEPTTPFRVAVIGWAGEIASELGKADRNGEPKEHVAEDTFEYVVGFDFAELSDTDRAAILGHKQVWRSCKNAHRILLSRFEELKREALSLIASGNGKFL